MDEKSDLLQGTLDLMVLGTLETIGPQHGFGIARRIEQVSGDTLQLNHGTVYPALVRLEHDGLIRGKWGTSDNNRRARFYSITPRGRQRIAAEALRWSRIAGVIERFLKPADGSTS
ncbi:MAG TPA: PadR family transcriptional regulator [Vicinamibacterales bacterium]|nr:PadR family transcriptional regulator [Vicinamibacterales bacterium]